MSSIVITYKRASIIVEAPKGWMTDDDFQWFPDVNLEKVEMLWTHTTKDTNKWEIIGSNWDLNNRTMHCLVGNLIATNEAK